jgi:hypothetical protein
MDGERKKDRMFGEKDSDIGTLFLLLYLPIIPHL